jgi:hypothetical protein
MPSSRVTRFAVEGDCWRRQVQAFIAPETATSLAKQALVVGVRKRASRFTPGG